MTRYLYVLNDMFEEVAIIENYKSLIWTERFDSAGDFQLLMPPDDSVKTLLSPGTVVSISDSNRMMVVETVVEKEGDGGFLFEFSGPSLESVLDARVAGIEGRSGSTKSWLNQLVKASLIDGVYHVDDKFGNLKFGWNAFYPTSTIPPSTFAAPYANSGWTGIGKAHEAAVKLSPLGFRIVRAPHTRQLYYDNYTGNNRIADNLFNIQDLSLVYPNPSFYETDNDVEVWRNMVTNPGFTTGFRPLVHAGPYVSMYGHSPTEVEALWSRSGKGLKVQSVPERTRDNVSAAAITGVMHALNNTSHNGRPWWGMTLTISARIEILSVQGGALNASARKITVFGTNVALGSFTVPIIASSNQAPNTVGVHDVSVTVTLPASGNAEGYTHFCIALWNGNGIDDEGVIWGDLCVMEQASNPVGYFDSEYSPDEDLYPTTVKVMGYDQQALKGKSVQGIPPANQKNCAFVQSTKWLEAQGGISGRMISNTAKDVGLHETVIDLSPKRAKRVQIKQFKPVVLSGGAMYTASHGKVQILDGATVVGETATLPNVIGTRSNDLSREAGFNKVVLKGDYITLGQSLYYDLAIISPEIAWSPKPNKQVVFSEDLDSFEVSTSRMSIDKYSNVVYVTRGDLILQMDDGYADKGMLRRVVHANADSVKAGRYLQAEMEAIGRKALGENRRSSLIDGEVTPNSRYVYDEDYFLGDIVLVMDRSNGRMNARVVEQIFVSDQNGERTYPTLREESSLLLGTWRAPEYNIAWSAADPLGTWANQP